MQAQIFGLTDRGMLRSGMAADVVVFDPATVGPGGSRASARPSGRRSAGWLPYWMERMDEHFEMLRPQMPKLKRPPSEHIAGGRIFVACDPDEKMLPQVLELVGEERVI